MKEQAQEGAICPGATPCPALRRPHLAGQPSSKDLSQGTKPTFGQTAVSIPVVSREQRCGSQSGEPLSSAWQTPARCQRAEAQGARDPIGHRTHGLLGAGGKTPCMTHRVIQMGGCRGGSLLSPDRLRSATFIFA